MNKLKSILLALLAAVMMVSPMGNRSVDAAEKVKVYIFEAGGCPYCEAEIEYLKGLDSYNKKFTIVEKELYIDHVDWEEGKDYALGKLVAEAFQQAGFSNASYTGTPFVVISDIYAAATYSESLSDYIEKAYKDGDKDVVGCYEQGGTECLSGVQVDPSQLEDVTTTGSEEKDNGSDVVKIIVLIMIVGGIVALAVLGRKKVNSDDFEEDLEEELEEKPKKEIVKEVKVTVKKTTTKKAEPKTEKKTTKSKSTTKKKK